MVFACLLNIVKLVYNTQFWCCFSLWILMLDLEYIPNILTINPAFQKLIILQLQLHCHTVMFAIKTFN